MVIAIYISMTSKYNRLPDKAGPSRRHFGWAVDRSITKQCCHILDRVGLPETRVFYEGLHTKDSRSTCYMERPMSIHQFRKNTSGHMITRSTPAALAVIIDPEHV